jgi:hypothetical protein
LALRHLEHAGLHLLLCCSGALRHLLVHLALHFHLSLNSR